MNAVRSKRQQAGVTLLELMISLSLLMLASIGMVQLADRYSDDVRASVVADQLKRIGDASRAYIKDNYTTIAATATSSAPYLITTTMLASGGYLPTGSISTNGYNQSVCTLVLSPSANKLQGLVVTEGGTTVDDLTLGNIVQLTGSSAGSIQSGSSSNITGAMGGWSIPVATWHAKVNNQNKRCDGTAGNVQVATGHAALALWFEDGSYQSNALYRDTVAGRPELNTVNTPIIFNATQTTGAACSTSGAIANDASGAVINCTGGTWKAIGGSVYWGDPVANYGSLGTCNAAATGTTKIAKTPSVGSGPRAYTCDGTTWQALAVDNSGNLTVANTLTAGTVSAGTLSSTNATLTNASIGTLGSTNINNSGTVTTGTINGTNGTIGTLGSTTINSTNINNTGIVSTNTVTLNGVATAGLACSPNGSVARDNTGLILSCQSGVWAKIGDYLTGQIAGTCQMESNPGVPYWPATSCYVGLTTFVTACANGWAHVYLGGGIPNNPVGACYKL
jgi:Tfp pilus assembly protein FimT